MIRAFVLVEAAVGATRLVANTLRVLDNIESADVVTGPYDIIAIVTGDDIGTIGNVVAENIQLLKGVIRTITCPVVET